MSPCEAKLLQAAQWNPITTYCAENGFRGGLYFTALGTKLPTNNENNNNRSTGPIYPQFPAANISFPFINKRVAWHMMHTDI